MTAEDSFRTIVSPCEAELKVKGSRFFARAAPITDREEAEKFLERIRKTYHDATHHCYAYRLGLGGEEMLRTGDDGEPAGSAGRPMAAVIEGMELTNLAAVVTRWFGGVKLGVGGLVRAYGGVTAMALQNAVIVTRHLVDTVSLECSYAQLSAILKTVEQFHAVISKSVYEEMVSLTFVIHRRLLEAFVDAVIEVTSGQVHPQAKLR